jgi:hypothetical protein
MSFFPLGLVYFRIQTLSYLHIGPSNEILIKDATNLKDKVEASRIIPGK